MPDDDAPGPADKQQHDIGADQPRAAGTGGRRDSERGGLAEEEAAGKQMGERRLERAATSQPDTRDERGEPSDRDDDQCTAGERERTLLSADAGKEEPESGDEPYLLERQPALRRGGSLRQHWPEVPSDGEDQQRDPAEQRDVQMDQQPAPIAKPGEGSVLREDHGPEAQGDDDVRTRERDAETAHD